MLRFFFRSVGLLLLACAFAAAIVDGTRSIAASAPVFTTLGQALALLAPEKLGGVESAASRASPFLRDPVLSGALLIPVWLLFGVLGGALLRLTRPRRPTVGFSNR